MIAVSTRSENASCERSHRISVLIGYRKPWRDHFVDVVYIKGDAAHGPKENDTSRAFNPIRAKSHFNGFRNDAMILDRFNSFS